MCWSKDLGEAQGIGHIDSTFDYTIIVTRANYVHTNSPPTLIVLVYSVAVDFPE